MRHAPTMLPKRQHPWLRPPVTAIPISWQSYCPTEASQAQIKTGPSPSSSLVKPELLEQEFTVEDLLHCRIAYHTATSTIAMDESTGSNNYMYSKDQDVLNYERERLLLDRFHHIWIQQLNRLRMFRFHHGHTKVTETANVEEENAGLFQWFYQQKALQKEGKLPPEKKVLLDSLGVQWMSSNNQKTHPVKHPSKTATTTSFSSCSSWERMYKALVDFKAKHGHTYVTLALDSGDTKLSQWVRKQRYLYKKTNGEDGRPMIPQKRKQLLDDIGFDWEPEFDSANREHKYKTLVDFRAKHGHLDIIQEHNNDNDSDNHYDNHYGLASGSVAWINQQCQLKDKGQLSDTRKKKLKDIGFSWTPLEQKKTKKKKEMKSDQEKQQASFEKRFQALLDFKAKHGHMFIPAKEARIIDSMSGPINGDWIVRRETVKIRGSRRK